MHAAFILQQCKDAQTHLDSVNYNTVFHELLSEYYACAPHLLPNDLTTLLTYEELSNQINDSIFAIPHHAPPEEILAIHLFRQMIMQDTFTLSTSSEQMAYYDLMKKLISNMSVFNHSDIHSLFKKPSEKQPFLKRMASYLTALRADETVSFHDDDLLIRPCQSITTFDLPGSNIKAKRAVLGEGNCYYRAVMINFLEQIIIAPERERHMRFEQLISTCQYLLTTIDARDPNKNQIERVTHFLTKTHDSLSLQKLDELLLSTGENTFDHDLVLIARYALAQSIRDNQNLNLDGITLRETLMATYEGVTVEEFIQQCVLTENVYAESAAIDASLLNSILGINITITISQPNTPPHVTSNPSLTPGCLNTLLPLNIKLMLSHEHYDILYPADTLHLIQEARKKVNNELLHSIKEMHFQKYPTLRNQHPHEILSQQTKNTHALFNQPIAKRPTKHQETLPSLILKQKNELLDKLSSTIIHFQQNLQGHKADKLQPITTSFLSNIANYRANTINLAQFKKTHATGALNALNTIKKYASNTYLETIANAFIFLFRAFFRMFDWLITAVTMAKQTKANTPNRASFFQYYEPAMSKQTNELMLKCEDAMLSLEQLAPTARGELGAVKQ